MGIARQEAGGEILETATSRMRSATGDVRVAFASDSYRSNASPSKCSILAKIAQDKVF